MQINDFNINRMHHKNPCWKPSNNPSKKSFVKQEHESGNLDNGFLKKNDIIITPIYRLMEWCAIFIGLKLFIIISNYLYFILIDRPMNSSKRDRRTYSHITYTVNIYNSWRGVRGVIIKFPAFPSSLAHTEKSMVWKRVLLVIPLT